MLNTLRGLKELSCLALLAVTGATAPPDSAGSAGGWALPGYVTGAGPTLAFWGPLGYGDEIHESDWIVSWRLGSEDARLVHRRDVPCLVPGMVSREAALFSFCDDLGDLGEIEGRSWLYPSRDGTVYLEATGKDGLETTLLRFDGREWHPLEHVARLKTLPVLSLPSGAPTLALPAGLQSDERAFARDAAGWVLFADVNRSVLLMRPDGGRRRIGFPDPAERSGRWDRIFNDARPWDSDVVLSRRLAHGGIEIAVVQLPSGEVSLHETVSAPTDEWHWSSVVRTGDGRLIAISEFQSPAGLPVRFFFREVGGSCVAVREVRVSEAPK